MKVGLISNGVGNSFKSLYESLKIVLIASLPFKVA